MRFKTNQQTPGIFDVRRPQPQIGIFHHHPCDQIPALRIKAGWKDQV
jgi:hypothetical protein